jgi:hypothetical protein
MVELMRRSKKEVLQMNAVETAQEIASFMKENDYKKRGLGWKKHCNDVSLTVTMENIFYLSAIKPRSRELYQ